jgi:hypothetical protein
MQIGFFGGVGSSGAAPVKAHLRVTRWPSNLAKLTVAPLARDGSPEFGCHCLTLPMRSTRQASLGNVCAQTAGHSARCLGLRPWRRSPPTAGYCLSI